MKIRQLHPWNVSYHEAIEIQRSLSPQVHLEKLPEISLVAGADVSYSKESNTIWAGVVVLKYPCLDKIEEKWIKQTASFPYIPGLLSFREIPPLLEVICLLEHEPDLFFCDGQGIAHQRGMGLASHLGLIIEKPTIGCAKSRLVGEYSELGPQKGSQSPLIYQGRQVGSVVRTRNRVRPLFVSPGYRVTIKEAVDMTLNCVRVYRIPEPIRQAHILVNRMRNRFGGV
ncbi:Endonuclease V [uncultured Desulfobacterium sp.]|uniref:Endonuclease V n=1 Tax=uncultured Desulfobacterium sp. TaxID=201089 RepID=A0A445N0A8_9BACT|nr:Endonuclease V [uncultured Desulfobacterium sp.]